MTEEQARLESFWQVPLPELLRRIEADVAGLSSAQAARRRARFGPNVIGYRRRHDLARRLAARLRNPLVLILIAAALVSGATGDLSSCAIISAIVVLSLALDSLQEHRAEAAAERLKASVAMTERALRDGREIILRAEELVPGDVVLLAAGDLVPADGRLLEARDFFVN